MANIMDYLDWRGDIPCTVSAFNEVDNYIISKIGAPDFTGIIPESEREISIGEAVRLYREKYGDAGNYLGILASQSIAPAIWRLPSMARYSALYLSGYVNKINPEQTEQFSALTVTLPGGRHFITFRGTDDTILAWKENFLMSVEKTVAAQRDALEYLKWAASAYPGELIVGGHSKGGNLAVFAAAAAPKEIQRRITDVYSFDGPGFHEDFLEAPGYIRIRSKLHVLVPRNSIVGVLLTQEPDLHVIKSSRTGIAAHDGFTWEVTRTGFVRSEALSRGSQSFDDIITAVLETMGPEDCRVFIDDLFGAFTATGAVTLTDMTEHRLRQAFFIVNSLRKSPESKKFVLGVIEQMLKEFTPIKKENKR